MSLKFHNVYVLNVQNCYRLFLITQ